MARWSAAILLLLAVVPRAAPLRRVAPAGRIQRAPLGRRPLPAAFALEERAVGGERRAADAGGPEHVAFILDGNGRWATEKGLPRSAGHAAGCEAAVRVVRQCLERDIRHVTLFALSAENWKRPKAEVSFLLDAMEGYLRQQRDEMSRSGVRFVAIGDVASLPSALRQLVRSIEAETEGGQRMTLCVAVSYGGRGEIAAAARELARGAVRGTIAVDDIGEDAVDAAMSTTRRRLPHPDLCIRTGGERRLSGFLLWQLAYAELCFLDVKWPDFGEEHLDDALRRFRATERRFGGLGPDVRATAGDPPAP